MAAVIGWTLVAWLSMPYAGGPVAVQGFSDKQACSEAGQKLEDRWHAFLGVHVSWVCVEVR